MSATAQPRSEKAPLYRRLVEECRAEIRRGAYRRNDRFPSERELVARHGISRVTANKVISNLLAEGLLVFRPGIGTFVAAPATLSASLREMESFTEAAKLSGHRPKTEVLAFEALGHRELPAGIADLLHLGTLDQAYYVERLRLADGEPAILEFRWISAALLPRLKKKDLQGSFYGLVATRGLSIDGEDHQIHACNLTREEARKLRVPFHSAALMVDGRGYTSARKPIWYQVLLYRGDRYVLENSIRHDCRADDSFLRLKSSAISRHHRSSARLPHRDWIDGKDPLRQGG